MKGSNPVFGCVEKEYYVGKYAEDATFATIGILVPQLDLSTIFELL